MKDFCMRVDDFVFYLPWHSFLDPVYCVQGDTLPFVVKRVFPPQLRLWITYWVERGWERQGR